MYVTLAPNKIPAQVHSIQQHHESLDKCSTGDIVCLGLGDTDTDGDDLDIRRGEVVSDSDNLASNCSSFTAQIIVASHPGFIKSGYTLSVHCGTARAPCRFVILDTMNAQTGCRIGKRKVKNSWATVVKMTPPGPFYIEKFSDYPALRRVVVRDLGRSVALGAVKPVEKC